MRKQTITFETNDGEIDLAGRFIVCPNCEGRGTHVNRNIDGNGITASEWAEWDEEERDSYMNGVYDVPCDECAGARVILVVDEARCDPDHLREYRAHERALAQDRAEAAAERRWER